MWSGNKASLKDGSFLVCVGTKEGKGCKQDDVAFIAWVQGAESSLCALHIKKLHIIMRVGADGRAIDVKVAVGLLTELDAVEVPCGSSTFAEGPVDEGTQHTVRDWPSVLKPKPGVRGRPYMYSVMLNRILPFWCANPEKGVTMPTLPVSLLRGMDDGTSSRCKTCS
jgi:hypothetical protein